MINSLTLFIDQLTIELNFFPTLIAEESYFFTVVICIQGIKVVLES